MEKSEKRTPELFARNMKLLFTRFRKPGFYQSTLADELGVNASVITKYMGGDIPSLRDDQYVCIARFMLIKICNSDTAQKLLCSLSGLDPFNYADIQGLGKDALIDELTWQLRNCMMDADFTARAEAMQRQEQATEQPVEQPVEPSMEQPTEPSMEQRQSKTRTSRAKGAFVATCVLAVMAVAFFIVWNVLPPKVTLTITHASPLGERNAFVTGTVAVSRGDPRDYAVTMAIVSSENGHTYAPKPSYANPTVEVTPTSNRQVGNFTCVYAPGDSPDTRAPQLHIYVVPASFIPSEDLAATNEASLAQETISR